MKLNIGERVSEWGRLSREDSLENMEKFLEENPDLQGFLDERSNSIYISNYGANSAEEFAVKVQREFMLMERNIPKEIARLIIKNPDIIDINVNEVIEHYNHLMGMDVSEIAAAVFASTDYAGRGSEDILEKIAIDYHVVKSSEVILEFPFYMQRYKMFFRNVTASEIKELGITFHVIDGLNGDF